MVAPALRQDLYNNIPEGLTTGDWKLVLNLVSVQLSPETWNVIRNPSQKTSIHKLGQSLVKLHASKQVIGTNFNFNLFDSQANLLILDRDIQIAAIKQLGLFNEHDSLLLKSFYTLVGSVSSSHGLALVEPLLSAFFDQCWRVVSNRFI